MPFFSIVIPCYNGAKTLSTTLDSVCMQVFKDFEVIIVNDGSTDSSLQIIKSYVDRLPLKIVDQSNAGLGAARNAGISHASGEFVAFLDADDLWVDIKLQRVFQQINALNYEVDVICHFEEVQRADGSSKVLRHGPYTTYFDLLFKGNTLSPSATCVRRSMLNSVGLFSLDEMGHGAEDWDLWLNLAKQNARIHYIEAVLGTYILYGNNMSEAPDFYKKGRYVFESHVSNLSSLSSDVSVLIKGARSIHELYAAKSHATHKKYKAAMASVWSAFSGGVFNFFFWGQLYTKFFSMARRAVS
ncbi:MAG: glycosyltransferase [Legionellaceae bacterium]|nr:glycosyltransferase [Legionellaceae bacterium]